MYAWHEAGHAVVAESFGYKVKGIHIGNKTVTIQLNKVPLESYENACIAMAGYFAASKYSEVDNIKCMMYCKNDYERAERDLKNDSGLTRKMIREEIYNRLDYNRLLYWYNYIYSLLDNHSDDSCTEYFEISEL